MKYTVLPINQSNIELLENSDRGFRIETYLNVSNGNGIYQYEGCSAVTALMGELSRYKNDHPKLAQVYFYLTDYKEQPLDDKAFNYMNEFMQTLRENNIKAILRFAYVWDDQNVESQEPSTLRIVEHLHQIEPFLYQWEDQIHVLQAGLIGAWGEWAIKARDRADETTILNTLLEVTPLTMKIQVRYTDIKVKNIDIRDRQSWDRVGYHDDFLIGSPHRWNTSGQVKWSSNYQLCLNDSKKQLVDGEMIWWWANPIYLSADTIDPSLIAQYLNEGSFTSLSLAHNYHDMDDTQGYSEDTWKHEFKRVGKDQSNFSYHDKEHYGEYSSISAWKKLKVEPTKLNELSLPYQPSWFKTTKRTWYEYIRDYLGYRIECTGFNIEEIKNGLYKCTINLINYGFSAPNGLQSLRIVALDKYDNILAYSSQITDLADLQTDTEIHRKVTFNVVDKRDIANFGIELLGKSGSGNRLANECQFVNGINIFKQD